MPIIQLAEFSIYVRKVTGSSPVGHIRIMKNKNKTLWGIWWAACVFGDNPILSFAKAAKKSGYTYEDCYKFIWTAAGLVELSRVKYIWELS